MKTRALGRTGLQVSELGFGAVEIGVEYGIQVDGRFNRPSLEDAVDIVRFALDQGINVIDTARSYGDSEAIVGRAIADRREKVVLMSKLAAIDEGIRGEELRSRIVESLENSLRTLDTDSIDVLQVHSASLEVLRRGEVFDALEELRQKGHLRFIGATVYTEDEAHAALDDERVDVLQIAYNMLATTMDQRVIPRATQQGVGIVARSVLHRGVLTAKGAHGSEHEKRLHDHACSFDFLIDDQTRSLPQAAVRFVLSHPGVACALLGMDSMEQVGENLAWGDMPSYPAELIGRVRSNAPEDPWAILPISHGP